MFKKVTQTVFLILFLLMLAVPLVTSNLAKDAKSDDEKRMLAAWPSLRQEDGKLNKEVLSEFEAYVNDRIGFRSMMVNRDAQFLFYVFGRFPDGSKYLLGPNGELMYASPEMVKDYQHLNLYSEKRLQEIAKSLQTLSDYAAEKGAKLYYYQCWDKHSIYPEHFPEGALQTGTESKTDGMVRAFRTYTDVSVISAKQELLDAKAYTSTYSVWGDATHWNDRGAYIGYRKLMDSLNADREIPLDVLEEQDFVIRAQERGARLYGGLIHRNDMIEKFKIAKPKAVLTNEKLTLYSEDQDSYFYTNDFSGNETRALVLCDSYFRTFIKEEIAESFRETVFLDADHLPDFRDILTAYPSEVVIIECAERVDRTKKIVNAAKDIREDAAKE